MDLTDDYNHIDQNLIYIVENIPTTETEEVFSQQFAEGCDCIDLCVSESFCKCSSKSGATYNYTSRGDTNSYTIQINDANKLIYECNSTCKCSTLCGNRLVQLGPRKDLRITQTESKGLGLVTSADIKCGNFICEYAGEIISREEAEQRHTKNKESNAMNYIFCVTECFGQKRFETYIDPTRFGNIGRYLNHSCEPNCELHTIRVNSLVPKLCIFSKTNVEENGELTFDYGGNDSSLNSNETYNFVKCLCNASNCKKILPFTEYMKD